MRYLLLLVLLTSCLVSFGQHKKIHVKIDTAGLGAAIGVPALTNPSGNDIVAAYTQRELDSVNQMKVAYTKFAYAYRMKLFEWQLSSSKIIFSVVVVIVLIGLYLSYLQFKLSEKQLLKPTDPKDTSTAKSQSATDLEINKDGIKIQSAVIGLIILVISIIFFFLYLKFVFPINGNP